MPTHLGRHRVVVIRGEYYTDGSTPACYDKAYAHPFFFSLDGGSSILGG